MKNNRATLFAALLVIFVDFIGVGIVYPLFSSLLFDTKHNFLPAETSGETRGAYLGILLALSPLFQFFSSPMWGALSDQRGRKKPLLYSLLVTVSGYVAAIVGVFFSSILLLLISRVIIGLASGNMSIVQAAVADVSRPEEKAKNFGLYSMALGAGFTLGPFFGGVLARWGYATPFFFALIISGLNLLILHIWFQETLANPHRKKLRWTQGMMQLKKAFATPSIRAIFLTYFLHCFAWSFFFEFIPVYLIDRFKFTAPAIGLFYSVSGAFYALSSGLLIRPLLHRLKPETLFFGGNFFTALTIFSIFFLPSVIWIWFAAALICYFVSFVTPTATTLISNTASSEVQGEMLGVIGSANAAALVLSPLFSGAFIGAYPYLTILVSSALLFICALLILFAFRKKIFSQLEK
ncbi:MAG: MFS transporter [Chlamydiales bacterium]